MSQIATINKLKPYKLCAPVFAKLAQRVRLLHNLPCLSVHACRATHNYINIFVNILDLQYYNI